MAPPEQAPHLGDRVNTALGRLNKKHRSGAPPLAVETAGTWQVRLDVQARRKVYDSAGVETEMPMDEWVEIGVFDWEERDDDDNIKTVKRERQWN